MKVVVATLTGTNGDPTSESGAAPGALERAGQYALWTVAVAWAVILALLARHRIVVTHDSLISYAHAWWINSQLWHGHGIPWRMPIIGHGTALTFPYGALPWLVAALLWPLLGEWAVTLVLVLAVLGVIAATFWAFPEARRPWWAVLVGDGPARAEIEALMAPFGPRVCFAGAVPHEALPAFYAAADLYLWPAINEAYGMAFLEAEASGLPVVAGRTGGVPAVVADGVAGILTPIGDAAAFAAAVARLLDDPAERRRLGAGASQRVLQRHDERVAARALGVALQLLR